MCATSHRRARGRGRTTAHCTAGGRKRAAALRTASGRKRTAALRIASGRTRTACTRNSWHIRDRCLVPEPSVGADRERPGRTSLDVERSGLPQPSQHRQRAWCCKFGSRQPLSLCFKNCPGTGLSVVLAPCFNEFAHLLGEAIRIDGMLPAGRVTHRAHPMPMH